MRIMADANIIVSAILFPNSVIAKVTRHIIDNYYMVLSKYTVDEIKDVFIEKFPHRINDMENFMNETPFELFHLKETVKKYPKIRDADDLPVLINAIESKSDLFITGDKDFDDVKIKNPRIMKPRKYFDEYMR